MALLHLLIFNVILIRAETVTKTGKKQYLEKEEKAFPTRGWFLGGKAKGATVKPLTSW